MRLYLSYVITWLSKRFPNSMRRPPPTEPRLSRRQPGEPGEPKPTLLDGLNDELAFDLSVSDPTSELLLIMRGNEPPSFTPGDRCGARTPGEPDRAASCGSVPTLVRF